MEEKISEEERKKELIKKIEKTAEEIRSKQHNENIDSYVNQKLTVLKKRENPYENIIINKYNNKKKRTITTVIVGLASLAFLAGLIWFNKSLSKN